MLPPWPASQTSKPEQNTVRQPTSSVRSPLFGEDTTSRTHAEYSRCMWIMLLIYDVSSVGSLVDCVHTPLVSSETTYSPIYKRVSRGSKKQLSGIQKAQRIWPQLSSVQRLRAPPLTGQNRHACRRVSEECRQVQSKSRGDQGSASRHQSTSHHLCGEHGGLPSSDDLKNTNIGCSRNGSSARAPIASFHPDQRTVAQSPTRHSMSPFNTLTNFATKAMVNNKTSPR